MEHLKKLAETINSLPEADKERLNLHLVDGGQILRALNDSPYEACLKSHAGQCGSCSSSGSFTPCS